VKQVFATAGTNVALWPGWQSVKARSISEVEANRAGNTPSLPRVRRGQRPRGARLARLPRRWVPGGYVLPGLRWTGFRATSRGV